MHIHFTHTCTHTHTPTHVHACTLTHMHLHLPLKFITWIDQHTPSPGRVLLLTTTQISRLRINMVTMNHSVHFMVNSI